MAWPEIYICHYGHEYDQIFTENLERFFTQRGISSFACELSVERRDKRLRRLLANPNAVILGYNSQLDHSYVDGQHFVTAAANRDIPVIQWILDHPASRWLEFDRRSSEYSAFLFNTEYEQHFFERFCAPGANTGVMGGIGPNFRSRVSENSKEHFFARPEKCLIALGLRRIGKTFEQTLSEISSLDTGLVQIINRSVDTARFDLEGPLEAHFIGNLQQDGVFLDVERFNWCFRIIEDCVQAYRRVSIFEIARRFPVCILSDDSAAVHVQGATAEFLMNVNMRSTLSRIPNFRSVLSVSPINDLIHDRTMNAINAGCVPIIEDNIAHRRVFEHGKNALMFRYGDSSLDECLNIVCNEPETAWKIAEQAFALRDDPRVFCVRFCNVIDVAARQRADLRGASGGVIKKGREDQQSVDIGREVAIGSESFRLEETTREREREREQLRVAKSTRALGRELDIRERLESAREAARFAQSTSVALGADLRAKKEHLVALQRQIELTRGEADLLVDNLQIQLAEARGEASYLRTRLSLFVEEQVQKEHRRISVSICDGQEMGVASQSQLRPSARAAAEKAGVRELAQAVGERDNRILKLGQEIIDLDSRIRALERELQRRDRRNLELKRDVLNGSDRILKLGLEVANRDHRILELEQQFGKLVSSLSWRITIPLRAVVRYLSPRQIRLLGRITQRLLGRP